MTKKYTYAFARKKQSEEGVISSILAGISLFLFLAAAVLSGAAEGKGAIYLGAVGLAAMGISVYGFVIGLKSFSRKDRSYRYSKMGSIANGVIMIGWLTLFLIGVS